MKPPTDGPAVFPTEPAAARTTDAATAQTSVSPIDAKPQPKTDGQLFEERREQLLQRYFPQQPTTRSGG